MLNPSVFLIHVDAKHLLVMTTEQQEELWTRQKGDQLRGLELDQENQKPPKIKEE